MHSCAFQMLKIKLACCIERTAGLESIHLFEKARGIAYRT